jgi:hypothetical protein
MADRTTIVISHDLLTVTDAQQILYLEGGRMPLRPPVPPAPPITTPRTLNGRKTWRHEDHLRRRWAWRVVLRHLGRAARHRP